MRATDHQSHIIGPQYTEMTNRLAQPWINNNISTVKLQYLQRLSRRRDDSSATCHRPPDPRRLSIADDTSDGGQYTDGLATNWTHFNSRHDGNNVSYWTVSQFSCDEFRLHSKRMRVDDSEKLHQTLVFSGVHCPAMLPHRRLP
jgi:hypothetical protein